ncbi:response regulator [Waterburya agarophytonicola K14]|uniref:Circadian input-output histidine kinase CikA n=1 Tax=Waterburya agarophytonicola KI4 TaxID=2874699 RepID=A0A964BRY0_9CYAN|nr:response regulator [Waterburya agarophytonicola]MCC0178365.1 response regulator [Waterburya agarophytonicola KI4]
MSDPLPLNQDKILIVDDVLDNLDLLSRILTRRGYTVRSVDNGTEAIEIAQTGWADLILLDINMPEMDGYQVCRFLKEEDTTSSIPVIFMSALDQTRDKVNAFRVGGVDYITKPFQVKEVIARVKTHLQLRNLQKNLETQVVSRTIELATALQEAKAANNVKNIFFSQMTHELRTPMNAILGFIQLMQRDSSLNSEHQEQLRIISHSGEHLMALINDVLEVSKIEAGRLVLTKNNFDLYRMLKGIEEMLNIKAQANNINFVIQRNDLVPQYIQTDDQKLQQVLINLLANAVKFTPKGQVSLKIGYNPQKPNQLDFGVEDTGYGIAPEELSDLFVPFVQTKTGSQSHSGTGLGLSISQQYVKLMGGEIKVTSQVDRGSSFSFSIQIEIGEPIAQSSEFLRVIGLQPNQIIPKILIAEDRWENRQFLVRLLEIVGFEVKEAIDGIEAIAIWSDWLPDLILMDLQMPVMDGYEAIQHIKRTDKSVVIIAITASQFKEQKQFILSSGCDDLLNLPFQEEELWLKIAHHLKVAYIYETPVRTISTGSQSQRKTIDPKMLTIMSSEWIEQLNYYATAANTKEIYSLLEQVPQQNADLVLAISSLVDDFCFEKIIHLTTATTEC